MDLPTAPQPTAPQPNAPVTERLRLEPQRRQLTVTQSTRITPNMLRLRLEGPALAGFASPSPGDHIKLMVPDGQGGQAMRDYTPRRFDATAGWIEIDFALHDAGPATLWALGARPGDPAVIGGPRGSMVLKGPIAHWLLVGDETALPSIGRRIEEMAAGETVTSLVAVPGPQDEQALTTAANHRALWVHRKDPTDATGLVAALRSLELGPQTYVWIAAEAQVARAVKAAALEKGLPPEWLRAAGYWLAGEADAAIKDV